MNEKAIVKKKYILLEFFSGIGGMVNIVKSLIYIFYRGVHVYIQGLIWLNAFRLK